MIKLLLLRSGILLWIFLIKLYKIYYINIQVMIFLSLILFLYLLTYKFNKILWLRIYYGLLRYDYLSYGLILLNLWISILLCIRFFNKDYLSKKLLLTILILFLFLRGTFIIIDIFIFYIWFEIRLIPIMFIIMKWGRANDRISSMFYILFYTLLGSIPLLYLIFLIYKFNLTLRFIIYSYIRVNFKIRFVCYFFYLIGFLVKIPIYIFHVWLPKAHVEAPVFGSIILAGVLLKLGRYGIYRFLLIIKNLNLIYRFIFMSVSFIGILNISLICLIQVDIKILVAYSSVVHMGLLLNGILTLSNMGYEGVILINIAHGLCSSGLFYLVNVIYERSGSRNIFLNKGFIMVIPSISLMWFFLCSSNLSAPLSLNLVSELILLRRLIMWNKVVIFYLILICFLRASYRLYLFRITQHGKLNSLIIIFNSGKILEFLMLILHWTPLNLFILNLILLLY